MDLTRRTRSRAHTPRPLDLERLRTAEAHLRRPVGRPGHLVRLVLGGDEHPLLAPPSTHSRMRKDDATG